MNNFSCSQCSLRNVLCLFSQFYSRSQHSIHVCIVVFMFTMFFHVRNILFTIATFYIRLIHVRNVHITFATLYSCFQCSFHLITFLRFYLCSQHSTHGLSIYWCSLWPFHDLTSFFLHFTSILYMCTSFYIILFTCILCIYHSQSSRSIMFLVFILLKLYSHFYDVLTILFTINAGIHRSGSIRIHHCGCKMSTIFTITCKSEMGRKRNKPTRVYNQALRRVRHATFKGNGRLILPQPQGPSITHLSPSSLW